MFKRILMAHDSSLCGWNAFDVALDLARKYGAELIVLHAIDTSSVPDIPHKDVLIKPLEERAKKLEEEVKKRLEESGIRGKFVVVRDRPVDAIVRSAEEYGADLIVLGARGLGIVSGYLLGSVSTKVVLTSKKSVLVVKGDAPAASRL
ncbi:MAG: universal stress protein [Crenarchaeota archaeon]|nr:universal stress protein [Thermoproteota archaeon]